MSCHCHGVTLRLMLCRRMPTSPPPAGVSPAAQLALSSDDTIIRNVRPNVEPRLPVPPPSLHIQQLCWPLGNDDAVPMGLHNSLQPVGIFRAAGWPPSLPLLFAPQQISFPVS